MKIEVIKGTGIAVISGGEVLVKDAQSALELPSNIKPGQPRSCLQKRQSANTFLYSARGLREKSCRSLRTTRLKPLFMETIPAIPASL